MRAFTVIDAPQGSPEWFAARCGRLTSSRASDATSEPRRKGIIELQARIDYREQLVAERLTGVPQLSEFSSKDTDRGRELEPAAFAAYEAETGHLVERVGFLAHNELMAGASPDGVINDFEGLVEIKAPRPVNHLTYLRALGVPPEHRAQCLHLLWLTGAQWLDFVSYCPALPAHLRLRIQRMSAAPVEIAEYDERARAFLATVDLEMAALKPIGQALVESLEVA